MNKVQRAKMLLIELETLKETSSIIGMTNLRNEVLKDAELLAKAILTEEENMEEAA